MTALVKPSNNDQGGVVPGGKNEEQFARLQSSEQETLNVCAG